MYVRIYMYVRTQQYNVYIAQTFSSKQHNFSVVREAKPRRALVVCKLLNPLQELLPPVW